jgi:hypothetical protein
MVVGAVTYDCKTASYIISTLDLASLQGTTIGSFGEKALCNGANLAQEIII